MLHDSLWDIFVHTEILITPNSAFEYRKRLKRFFRGRSGWRVETCGYINDTFQGERDLWKSCRVFSWIDAFKSITSENFHSFRKLCKCSLWLAVGQSVRFSAQCSQVLVLLVITLYHLALKAWKFHQQHHIIIIVIHTIKITKRGPL